MSELNTNLLLLVVIVYAVLFMEWETSDTPFHGVCFLSFKYPVADLANMFLRRFVIASSLVSSLYSPAHHLLVL